MLTKHINGFLGYCKVFDFSGKSIQSLSIRLNEFNSFLKPYRIRSFKKITYRHLFDPNVAKVEDAAGPRHQDCSCSRLPQSLDNDGDAVSSAFPKGKQHCI